MKQFYVYVYRDPSRGDEPIYVGKGRADVSLVLKPDRNSLLRRKARIIRSSAKKARNPIGLASRSALQLARSSQMR